MKRTMKISEWDSDLFKVIEHFAEIIFKRIGQEDAKEYISLFRVNHSKDAKVIALLEDVLEKMYN